jgi:hypothetical protein
MEIFGHIKELEKLRYGSVMLSNSPQALALDFAIKCVREHLEEIIQESKSKLWK